MRRKNFILTMLMFLFISILSIAVENPTTLSDTIGLVDPAFQEGLKEYKPNLENIDKLFNYIEKNIKEKGRAIFYSKLEKEKNFEALTKIIELIEDILKNGLLKGRGKPEKLKYSKGEDVYSRRIDKYNRLIYKISTRTNKLLIVGCKGHYENIKDVLKRIEDYENIY